MNNNKEQEKHKQQINECLNLSLENTNTTANEINKKFESLFFSLPVANLFALVIRYFSQSHNDIVNDKTLKWFLLIGLSCFLCAYICSMIYYACCQIMYDKRSKNTQKLSNKTNGNPDILKNENEIKETIKTNNQFPNILNWFIRLRNIMAVFSAIFLTFFFIYGVYKMTTENNQNKPTPINSRVIGDEKPKPVSIPINNNNNSKTPPPQNPNQKQ